jgi:hypothetical protein
MKSEYGCGRVTTCTTGATVADSTNGRTCWAAPLGGCDEKISGEHIVTQSLFPDKIIAVQGFDWCRDEAKHIGKAGLTRKILCRKHNTDLSVLDQAALDSFDVFRRCVELNDARNGINAAYLTLKKFHIDSLLLERWMLKTLVNVALGGRFRIGPGDHAKGEVAPDLIEIAFGRREFTPHAGLYIAGSRGETYILEDRVQLITKTDGETLVGTSFIFRGMKFYLNLLPQRFSHDDSSKLMYREATLNFTVRNKRKKDLLSHRISIRHDSVVRGKGA